MKRLILVFSVLILSLTTFSQKVFHPFDAYLKKGTEWIKVEETEKAVYPNIIIYFNGSDDGFSMIDRVEIENGWNDTFIFPYKGVNTGNRTITWKVFDKEGKSAYFSIGFYEDDANKKFSAIKISYNNVEYMYLCRY